MHLIDTLAGWLGYRKEHRGSISFVPARGKRDFAAALQTRLTNDWNTTITSADAELKGAIKPMRSRCRDLERNNDYARRYLKLLDNNVLGSTGIGLQMKIREWVKSEGKMVQQYDTRANQMIEDGWYKWSRRQFCTVTKTLNLRDVQGLVLRTVARDGACLVRKHYPADNPFHFALEPIEPDQLDTDFSTTNEAGNVVRLGVEYDKMQRVVAYHILKQHPGEIYQQRVGGLYRERISANQFFHVFCPERIGQSTGAPWMVSAATGLRNVDKYCEAEVVAARVSAAKMGFLVPSPNSPNPGYTGPSDSQGNKYMEVEPGSVEMLPFGYDFKAFDPTHPNSAFGDFVKSQLRGIAAGLNVSYNSLANDLESVNYSSIRAGLLDEREEWKRIQNWFVDWFLNPVFEEWLNYALMSGAITDGSLTLPASKFEKFNSPEWKPRRWDWVDPLKDQQANVLAVEKGFKSRRSIIAESGGDIEDTFADIAADEALAEEYDLDFDESQEAAMDAQETPDEPDSVDKEEKTDA